MKRAGMFIFLMAAIGIAINWNDYRGGNVDFDSQDFNQFQIILGVFAVIGLGLIGYDWFKTKRS